MYCLHTWVAAGVCAMCMHLQGRGSVCATRSITCDALKSRTVARKIHCATQPTAENRHFCSNYGVRFGSLSDPSWPRCSQRATKINTNVKKKVLGRPVVLLKSPPPKKAHFFSNFGFHLGPLFDPSWPRCSQRATQINTNAKKKLSFGRSYFY